MNEQELDAEKEFAYAVFDFNDFLSLFAHGITERNVDFFERGARRRQEIMEKRLQKLKEVIQPENEEFYARCAQHLDGIGNYITSAIRHVREEKNI